MWKDRNPFPFISTIALNDKLLQGYWPPTMVGPLPCIHYRVYSKVPWGHRVGGDNEGKRLLVHLVYFGTL